MFEDSYQDKWVSVPLWGLFNLTIEELKADPKAVAKVFPSSLGDYLI